MTEKLIECIPNFSEGRRPEIIEALMEAVRNVPDVLLLDHHSDVDHNRTVLTFVGPPGQIEEAAFAGIKTAAELIDLESHTGEHPRIGAADVVPFVPIAGVSMEECVQIARDLGQRVSEELDIPVYLYEAAASRPDRSNLEDIRRGEYEELKKAIESEPARAPDFGPHKLGRAGATVIGARKPLIAFNVYLDTDNLEVSQQIARAIRHSSGGLRYVKALGLMVEGLAQVSMNLTDYTRTPVARVVEAIRREASRHGVLIHHSELVGLIPQEALIEAAQWYLQLDAFELDQVLETRLYAARAKAAEESPSPSFLARLASASATPGGGSAAAYAGAMAASLVAMVARLTLGRKKYAQVEKRMQEIVGEADQLQAFLHRAVSEDSQAFDRVMEAYRMPKETEEEKNLRSKAIQQATCRAAEVPLSVAKKALRVMELAAQVAEQGNVNALSDAFSANALARAAIQAAGMNVQVNASVVKDEAQAGKWLRELSQLENQAGQVESHLQETLAARRGR